MNTLPISRFRKGLTDGIVGMEAPVAQVVDNFTREFGLLKVLTDRVVTRRYVLLRLLILLLLLGLVGGSAAAGIDLQKPPATSLGHGLPFAIADFDGDLRPDLASIQAGPNSSGSTDYWIQVQLSAAGRRSMRVVAPTGGLLIEARDVNGDHAVDLVLSTAWRRQPVAILLNDGHGSFSRVESNAFPGAFSESTTKWTSNSKQATEAIGVPPQSSVGIWPEASDLPHVRSRTGSILPSSLWFLVSSSLISYAGRAPPSEAPHT
jgi:hypothetical protein